MKDFIKKKLKSILGFIQNNFRPATENKSPIDIYFEEVSRESYEFFKNDIFKSACFVKDEDIRSYCIRKALKKTLDNSMFLEFGVFKGDSTKLFSSFLSDQKRIIYGFDSFEGLDEEWLSTDYNPKGKFSLSKKQPNLPKNVKIIKGRVEETLENFLKENKNKIVFCHLDLDNYSPTKFVLQKIKPQLFPGSILLFDEFYGYQNWKEQEYRALKETFKEDEYKYIAFGKRQASIEIL